MPFFLGFMSFQRYHDGHFGPFKTSIDTSLSKNQYKNGSGLLIDLGYLTSHLEKLFKCL